MIKYRGEIAALLGEVSLWAGVSAAVLEKHMRDLTDTLIRLEKLHQDTHRTYGHLRVPDFFEKRKNCLKNWIVNFSSQLAFEVSLRWGIIRSCENP